MTTTRAPLSPVDRDALERAVEIARRLRPDLIDDWLAEQPWLEAAVDAARLCQENALALKPWQCWPPCAVAPNDTDAPGLAHRGIRTSARLLRRMLAANVSRFEPDPLNALARVERAA